MKITTSAYAEKLKDPRWQRKRLEIFSRDDFACQFCFDTESTLHCHHLRYIKDADPWDYPDGHLLTLCEACHEAEHRSRRHAIDRLEEMLTLVVPCSSGMVEELTDVLCSALQAHQPDVAITAIKFALRNESNFVGLYFDHLSSQKDSK